LLIFIIINYVVHSSQLKNHSLASYFCDYHSRGETKSLYL